MLVGPIIVVEDIVYQHVKTDVVIILSADVCQVKSSAIVDLRHLNEDLRQKIFKLAVVPCRNEVY